MKPFKPFNLVWTYKKDPAYRYVSIYGPFVSYDRLNEVLEQYQDSLNEGYEWHLETVK